jgi:hypothetical protein
MASFFDMINKIKADLEEKEEIKEEQKPVSRKLNEGKDKK